MASDWKRRSIGDFASRKKLINERGEDLPPLSVTKDRGVVLQSEKYNKRVATDPKKYVVVEDGDFAFDPMGLYYGAFGRVSGLGRGLISPDYVAFTVDSSVDPTFIRYLLRSPSMVQRYGLVAQAGNHFGKRRRVYWSVFRDLEVTVPPLAAQRKIGAVFASLDDAIRCGAAVVEQGGVVRNGLLVELMTRGLPARRSRLEHTGIGSRPAGWRVARLGELADFVNGRAFKPSDWSLKGLPIVRIQNLNGSTEFNHYDGDVEPRFLLSPGDLLFSWSGTRGTSFGPHIWSGPAGILNQHIFNVRDLRGVSKMFFYYALKWVTSAVEERAHGGTGIVHITKGELESFAVPVPSLEEQREIASHLAALDDSFVKNKRTLDAAQVLKDSLLDGLLSGRVPVAVLEKEVA